MSIRKVMLVSAISLAALSRAANADTVTFTGGSFGPPPPGSTVETFDNASLPAGTVLNGWVDSFATFTGTGIIESPPTIPGISAEPFGDTTNYLSVQAGKSETITFGPTAPTTFGFFWGSVDTYNTVHINFVGGGSEDITPPAPGNGNQTDANSNGYWELISTSGAIASVVLGTGNTNAFEIDNFFVVNSKTGGGDSNSAPLPAALPLFAGGLGLISLFARRKRRAAA